MREEIEGLAVGYEVSDERYLINRVSKAALVGVIIGYVSQKEAHDFRSYLGRYTDLEMMKWSTNDWRVTALDYMDVTREVGCAHTVSQEWCDTCKDDGRDSL